MIYWVNENGVPMYQPAGHDGTFNRRLVGKENGLDNVELVVGVMDEQGYAAPHAHDQLEQVMYLISGKLKVRIGEAESDLEPGSAVAIPQGAVHEVWSKSRRSKFLVIYAPPK